MAETNTEITWPSKLKIGAKSKKGIFFLNIFFFLPPPHTTPFYSIFPKYKNLLVLKSEYSFNS